MYVGNTFAKWQLPAIIFPTRRLISWLLSKYECKASVYTIVAVASNSNSCCSSEIKLVDHYYIFRGTNELGQ